MKEEWAEVEHLANEGVSRVRSEMAMSVVESVERRRSQLDSIEVKLRQERESALS
jgi:heme exporter protein D